MDHVARFLESQGFKEEALALSTDPDQRFDLAVQLAKLDVAKEIMVNEIKEVETIEAQHKWKQLGDLALNDSNMDLFEDCALRSDDLSGLLLLYTSTGDAKGMEKLTSLAKEKGRNNVAFMALFYQNRLKECVELLLETQRFTEAALFTRTYLPSMTASVVTLWRADLAKDGKRVASRIACPERNKELFPDWDLMLEAEKQLAAMQSAYMPATAMAETSTYERYSVPNLKQTGSIGLDLRGTIHRTRYSTSRIRAT